MSLENEISTLTQAVKALTEALVASRSTITTTHAVGDVSQTVTIPYTPEVPPKVASEIPEAVSDFIKFNEALARHDWTYAMSDDPRVCRAGEASEQSLKAWAKRGGKEYADAYDAAQAKAWRRSSEPAVEPPPAPEQPKPVTRDELREIAKKKMSAPGGTPIVKKAVADFGVASITACPDDKLVALKAVLEALP